MELTTNTTKLWYFPPDSDDDVPRYAISKALPDGTIPRYTTISEMTAQDILKIQPLRVNSDMMQVSFRGENAGVVDFGDDSVEESFAAFVSQWKNGIKFLETTAAERKVSASQLRQIRQKEEKRRQKLELCKFLCSNLSLYVKSADVGVRIVTWNLQGRSRAFETEKEGLINLLGIGESHADMYVIYLQETVALNAMSFYSSPVLVSEWGTSIVELLNEHERPNSLASTLDSLDQVLTGDTDNQKYEYLTDNRLLGLLTIVIVRRSLKKQILNVEVATTGTGILNVFGNKGAILVKFTLSYDKDILPYVKDESNELSEEERQALIHGYKLVFVNTHLTDGADNSAKRKKELQAIEKNLGLREFFPDDSFFLVNPMEDYSDIDAFKFTDQETIKDNRLLSSDDLNKGRESTKSLVKNSVIPSPSANSSTGQFDDVPIKSDTVVSPALNKLPMLPTFSEAMTFRTYTPKSSEISYFNDTFMFLGGDMNFRLVPLEPTEEPEFLDEIKDLISQKRIDSLIERDLLSIEKANLRVLSGFNEAGIDFMPTYKYKVETPEDDIDLEDETKLLPYDFTRVPSYTDRIFYSEGGIFEGGHIQVNGYKLVDIAVSDHRPVYLDATLKGIQMIDFDARYRLMKGFLKSIDLQENASKPDAEVTPVDLKSSLPVLGESAEYEITIANQGSKRFTWEIVNYDKNGHFLLIEGGEDGVSTNYLDEPIVEISPVKGVLPSTGVACVKVKVNSISVGIRRIVCLLILRIVGAKDFFVTCEFTTSPSVFGESLDMLNNAKSFGLLLGIPPAIHELVNYLSNHLHEGMFHNVFATSKPELRKQILSEVDISIRTQLEKGSLDHEYIGQAEKFADQHETSQAALRTLVLLLRHLDGGIIPQEFATFILEEITLPSIFSLGGDRTELQSDIVTKILEYLPGLRANVFMYLLSFLTLYHGKFKNADKNAMVAVFEDALISLPSDASRALKSKRREVLKILI